MKALLVFYDSQSMTEDAVDRYFGKCRYGEYIFADMASNEYNFGKFIKT